MSEINQTVTGTKNRDISIDILKCIAAIMITNSHMDLLYGKYSALATGGAIGDALFFFCSGFTIFLGANAGFFNWYKKRINRIYPTVFAWALLAAILNFHHHDMFHVLISGGGWFVSCIMIYYVIMWFVKTYAKDKLLMVFIIVFAVILGWYLLFGIGDTKGNNMYGNCYFKWCHNFVYMLLGASLGLRRKQQSNSVNAPVLPVICMLLLSVALFYGLCWFKNKDGIYDFVQMASIFPLMGVCYFLYQFCNTKPLTSIYSSKVGNVFIRLIGGLCLEIYLVQFDLFTDKMNSIFPLNLLVMFAIIVVAAYVLRCVSRLWSQTFKDGEYDWKAIIQL